MSVCVCLSVVMFNFKYVKHLWPTISCKTGTLSGDVQLGETCSSGDTCVDASLELVCDDFDNKCREL